MLKPADRTRVRTATLAGISAAAICGMALVAAPAQATTVYQDPVLSTGIEIGPSGSTTCHVISQAANQPTDPIGLGDNDAKSVTLSGTTLMEPTLGAGTSITAKSTLKLTTKTTTLGGSPRSIRLSGSSTTSTVSAVGNTCQSRSTAHGTVEVGFALSQGYWATLKHSSRGAFTAMASLGGGGSSGDDSHGTVTGSFSLSGSGSTTVFLPAGNYGASLQAGAEAPFTEKSRSSTGSGTVTITFAAAGSAASKPTGSALGYTSLGAARSCSTHGLSAGVTSSTTRFRQLSRVSWSVNGTTVKSLKGSSLKRGLKVRLPISDASRASVKTTVVFKTGKSATAKASYLACR